jgi:hypothetical protein
MADINVTFDTCSLDWIVKDRLEARKVRQAIVAGRVQGFYCETLVTLEGVQKKERRQALGRTRPVSRSFSTGKNTIKIAIGFEHYRPALHATHAKMVEDIEAMGMRALRAPARMCGIRAKDDQVKFFLSLTRPLPSLPPVWTRSTRWPRKSPGTGLGTPSL